MDQLTSHVDQLSNVNVVLSEASMEQYHDLKQRLKNLGASAEARSSQLQEATRDFGPQSQHFLRGESWSPFCMGVEEGGTGWDDCKEYYPHWYSLELTISVYLEVECYIFQDQWSSILFMHTWLCYAWPLLFDSQHLITSSKSFQRCRVISQWVRWWRGDSEMVGYSAMVGCSVITVNFHTTYHVTCNWRLV